MARVSSPAGRSYSVAILTTALGDMCFHRQFRRLLSTIEQNPDKSNLSHFVVGFVMVWACRAQPDCATMFPSLSTKLGFSAAARMGRIILQKLGSDRLHPTPTKMIPAAIDVQRLTLPAAARRKSDLLAGLATSWARTAWALIRKKSRRRRVSALA